MKPKMNLFFLLLITVGIYTGIGTLLVPAIMPIWLFYICSSRENTLLWSIAKRRSARNVMTKLITEYRLNPDAYTNSKYKIYFPKAISDALTSVHVPQCEIDAFQKFNIEASQVLAAHFIWNSIETTSGQTLKRHSNNLKASSAQKRVAKVYPFGFSIISKDVVLWIYPQFVIRETRQSFDLVHWSDFDCEIKQGVLLKENKFIPGNHNVVPFSIEYQHTNKNGSPDKRFKTNAAYPIYLFTPLILKTGADITSLALREEDALTIKNTFDQYKRIINKNISNQTDSGRLIANYDSESITNILICQN